LKEVLNVVEVVTHDVDQVDELLRGEGDVVGRGGCLFFHRTNIRP